MKDWLFLLLLFCFYVYFLFAQLFLITISLIITVHIACIIFIYKVQVMDHENKKLTNEEKLYLSKRFRFLFFIIVCYVMLCIVQEIESLLKKYRFVSMTYILSLLCIFKCDG